MDERDKMEETFRSLHQLVTDFTLAMRNKFWIKVRQGKDGTDSADELRRQMANCIFKYDSGKDPAQLVDIANLAALLWRLEVTS